jgi:hypothetical protein
MGGEMKRPDSLPRRGAGVKDFYVDVIRHSLGIADSRGAPA